MEDPEEQESEISNTHPSKNNSSIRKDQEVEYSSKKQPFSQNELKVSLPDHVTMEANLCEPCSFDNDTVNSSAFCIDCLEYICKTCLKDHKKNKMTRNHKVLVEGDMPPTKEAFASLKSIGCCKSHPDKDAVYKCLDHNEYICIVCEGNSHRKCEHIEEIEKLSKNDIDVADNLMETIEENIGIVTRHNQKKSANTVTLENDLDNVKDELNRSISEMTDMLLKIKDQLSDSARRLVNKEVSTCKTAIAEGDAVITKYSREREMLKMAMKYGSPSQIHIAVQRINDSLSILDKRLEMLTDCDHVQLKFSPSLRDISALEIGSININKVTSIVDVTKLIVNESLDRGSDAVVDETELEERKELDHDKSKDGTDAEGGNEACNDKSKSETDTKCANEACNDKSKAEIDAKCANEACNDKSLTGMDTKDGKEACDETSKAETYKRLPITTLTRPLINCPLKCVGTHNIGQDTNTRTSNIYGIVYLEDKLVLIDRSNSLLLMLDSDFSIVSQMSLESEPLGLCAMDESIVVLTLRSRKVQRYTITDEGFKLVNEFNVKLNCRGIARAGNDVAILMADKDFDDEVDITVNSDDDDDVIEAQVRKVHNGHKVKVVDEFFGKSGNNDINIKDPIYLLYMHDDCIILGENNKLSEFDTNNRRQRVYRNYKDCPIRDIRGLTTDDEGNIYACGIFSNNVHQISYQNFRVNRIIIKDITGPWAIAFDSKRKRLVVSCVDSDFLTEYQFTN